jgi:hypothetical protein
VPVAEYEFDRRSLLGEIDEIRRDFPELRTIRTRLAERPAIAQERRLRLSGSQDRRSVLFDCSHVDPVFSGTTECAVNILMGVHASDMREWDVCVSISSTAKRFFDLDDRCPNFHFVPPDDTSRFDVAIRLGQAWSMSTCLALARRARSIGVMILDIIGIDIVYGSPASGNDSFRFLGEYADGLMYISKFTRQQFRRRYFTRPGLIESVVHLSLDPKDYLPQEKLPVNDAGYVLVVGNAFEHKDLPRTVEILAAAFPLQNFKVIGMHRAPYDNVEAFSSGNLSRDFVDRLYAGAKLIVFPSFYEGFGFPILKGLAFEKCVIARRSELLHELAPVMPDTGRLIEYENTFDLPPILAKLLDGKEVPGLHLGREAVAGGACHDWKACGALVLDFANRLIESEDAERWLARDRCFQYVFGAHARA